MKISFHEIAPDAQFLGLKTTTGELVMMMLYLKLLSGMERSSVRMS